MRVGKLYPIDGGARWGAPWYDASGRRRAVTAPTNPMAPSHRDVTESRITEERLRATLHGLVVTLHSRVPTSSACKERSRTDQHFKHPVQAQTRTKVRRRLIAGASEP